MKETKKNLLKAIREVNSNTNFKLLDSDFSNVDDIYKNCLMAWVVYSKKDESSDKNNFTKKPDSIIYSLSNEGLKLSEVDFIDSELKKLLTIEVSELNNSEQKKFEFYNEYLSKKRSKVNWTLNDYYKHYIKTKSFGFCYLFTYKSNQFDKLTNLLIDYKKKYDYIFNLIDKNEKIEFYNDFTDQLNKLKNKQTESKFKELIQNMIVQINSEYNHFKRLSDSKIESYKKATLNYFASTFESLNEDKTKNPFYYDNQIRAFLNYKNKLVKDNKDLNNNSKHLMDFNASICETLNITFKIFKASHKYKIDEVYHINEIIISELELKEYLNYLKRFSQTISNEVLNENIQNAIRLKQYCITSFKEMKDVLSNGLKIDTNKSPLKNDFDEVLKELENSINIDELKFLKVSENEISEQPQQTETNKPDEKYKTQNLFKVGLLFAEGKMNKYFTVNSKNEIVMNCEFSAPIITRDIKESLKVDVNNKYILASLNNYTTGENKNKNIFNSVDMMKKVISHCEAENIPVERYFKSRLPIY